MIEIKSNTITHNEIIALHKVICVLHKTDYGLKINSDGKNMIATLEDM